MNPRADRGATELTGVVLPERYEPMRRIARGGMAIVWCAQDHTLDRNVAIKLLAEPYAYDELAARRFKREARAAARLSGHPNVVTIYDVGQAPLEDGSRERPFLVMEYLSGGTVADALRTGHLDQVAALRWVTQAAAALDYAHRRGVIHRDVKLANFLLDRERVLHVADFGIAQLGSEDTLTVSGEVLGTAAYLAPERALGQPATEASDRYALAVAAYELLVGERPFTAEHFAAQARQHLEDDPPAASQRNPQLPPALDAVLIRGMAKRPEDRFATASELAEAIEQAFAPAPGYRVSRTATAPMRPVSAPRAPARQAAADAAAAAAIEELRRARPGQRPASGMTSSTRARVGVLAALAAVLLGVAVAAATSGGAPRHSATKVAATHPASKTAGGHHPTRRPTASVHKTTSTAAGTTSQPTPPASTTPAGGADALESQGHQLMVAGNYQSAIPVLRQAVATATPNSLTYAYALYDLGRSLRLAGNPRAAVQILWRRLQIPNQTAVVRTELALALQALGQQASVPPGPGHSQHHSADQGD